MPQQEIEILLVEDDPEDLELTLHALRAEQSCTPIIEVARDGAQALDFLFCRGAFCQRDPEKYPKLILLDLKVPKVNGLEVLRQIKSHSQTRFIPVVILTSSIQETDMVRAYEYGANSYLQKPVDFDRFRETIRHLGRYWLLVNQAPPRVCAE
ncbi:MAG TPA: response regulator [Bryobacteraceae bacterium]|nr:response regulator [Bryobacteraceae bacterium]